MKLIDEKNIMTKDKPYNTLNNYYKAKYGFKVAKISLNANFSCPNKANSNTKLGCSFCSIEGFSKGSGKLDKSLQEQFNDVSNTMESKWPGCYYIPYLQANSNTFASIDKLKNIYTEILELDKNERFVQFAIATRCDCLEDEKIAYLSELNKKIPIQIELGLQSANDQTLKDINSGFTLDTFTSAVKKLRKENIEVVVHIINGLPNETKEMMIDTIKYLNSLNIQGIKIHSLLVFKDTRMHKDYVKTPFRILSLEEYTDIVCEQLAYLDNQVIVHRLSADADKDLIETPHWPLKKLVVMNEIDKRMRTLGFFQGMKNKKS